MAKQAAKDIFDSCMHVPPLLRGMFPKWNKSHKLLMEGVRKYRSDASAGEVLRLRLLPGTPVLAPADMRLVEATEGGPHGPCAVFRGRRHIFTFYKLAFNDGLSNRSMKAGSVIGVAGTEILHLMVTKKRFLDGCSGHAVDAMGLIQRGIILPPFRPGGLD